MFNKICKRNAPLLFLYILISLGLVLLSISQLFNSYNDRIDAQSATVSYYVDCSTGNDTNTGTSPTAAWKTITKANTTTLVAGQAILLKRGCVWTGSLQAKWNGTAAQAIVIDAYGSGELPIIKSNTSSTHPVSITGSYLLIKQIHATADAPQREVGCENNPVGYINGFHLHDSSHHITLQQVKATGLQAGADIRYGSHHNKILQSIFQNNIMMSRVNNTDPFDDAGAFGIVLHGSDNEIGFNEISGNDACSYDYGRDGASVEIYGGSRNVIHHNRSWDSNAFSELGKRSTDMSEDNVFAYNTYISHNQHAVFINTRGAGNNFGPISRTLVYNNSVYVTGSEGQGIVCSSCGPDILTLRNNIIWANWKAVYASAPFNESHNIYWKTGGNPFLQLQGGGVMSTTSKKIDPQFKNPEGEPGDGNTGTGDLHINQSSPAINTGSTEPIAKGFTVDIDGQSVPIGSGPDIGADEFNGTTQPPTITISPTVGPTLPPPPPGQTYTFAAVGDTGADYDAREVFKKIGQTNPHFFIHLGDMMYGHLASEPNPEQAWCNFVKQYVGSNIPVELVTGNHEDMDGTSENYGREVNKIIPCLSNRIKTANGQDAITGQYGYEYYFDYPVASPIARHINIAPYIMDETGDRYSYQRGTKHYDFVKNAIDDAQAKGIKWIIVSMHHTCLSKNSASCTTDRTPKSTMSHLMNMLIAEKVDLILQGHIHSYQRSKQLALSSGCPVIIQETGTTIYNAACIADAGTSGTFTKGKGTIITINGSGGIGISNATNGSFDNYFSNWFGKTGSGSLTHGFSTFIVSDREIRYSFDSASWEYRGNVFTDTFKIVDTTNPTIPTTPPTTSPTVGQGTRLSLTVGLHGIGKGGDNVNPTSTGTTNPLHPVRNITLQVFNAQNQLAKTLTGTVSFSSGTGLFTGTLDGGNLATGFYTVKLGSPYYLTKAYQGVVSLIASQTATVPQIKLVTGDSNLDNKLDILDFNIIRDCFSELEPAKACSTVEKKTSADLTDDGNVNQFDYNLFLRELSVQSGE